jgi:putative Ca2+/H+ antiporter (TMEM165/GDT1 family)
MTIRSTQYSSVVWASFLILLIVTLAAAWVTHVVVSIKATAWVLLVIGAIFFPIGVIHGIGYWFGAF